MRRIHFDVGDAKVACMYARVPDDMLRSRAHEYVTCMNCMPYARGERPVGEFSSTTIYNHQRRAERTTCAE